MATPQRMTFSIHGDTSDRQRYKEFIENLRSEVSDPNRQKHGFRVLYDEKAKTELSMPNDFLDVCLEVEEKSISLLMRRDNLYIVGFKSNKLNNPPNYFESRDENKKYMQIIPNSKASKICDDYHSRTSLHELSFNKYTLGRAVDALYKATAQSCSHQVKVSIMILIVTISEAMRLEKVSRFISNQIVSDDPKTLGSEELGALIINWAYKSRRVLDNYDPPNAKEIHGLKKEITLVKTFIDKEDGRYDFTPSKNQKGKRK